MTVSRSGIARQVRPTRPPDGFPRVWGPDRVSAPAAIGVATLRGRSPGSQCAWGAASRLRAEPTPRTPLATPVTPNVRLPHHSLRTYVWGIAPGCTSHKMWCHAGRLVRGAVGRRPATQADGLQPVGGRLRARRLMKPMKPKNPSASARRRASAFSDVHRSGPMCPPAASVSAPRSTIVSM
jgi:hypothetical protein